MSRDLLVRQTLLLFVVLGAMALTAMVPALTTEGRTQEAAQYDQYEMGAGELQYEETGAAEAGCDWYWGYRWYSAGAWEWWCWDPQLGWWYATDETGSKQFSRINVPGSFTNVLRI